MVSCSSEQDGAVPKNNLSVDAEQAFASDESTVALYASRGDVREERSILVGVAIKTQNVKTTHQNGNGYISKSTYTKVKFAHVCIGN